MRCCGGKKKHLKEIFCSISVLSNIMKIQIHLNLCFVIFFAIPVRVVCNNSSTELNSVTYLNGSISAMYYQIFELKHAETSRIFM